MQDVAAPANPTRDDDTAFLAESVRAAGDLHYVWNLETDRIRWSDNALERLGYDDPESIATGLVFQSRVNPEDLPRRRLALLNHFAGEEPYDCEYRLRTADGGFCWVHDVGRATFSEDGEPRLLAGALRIVTARKNAEARLEQLANYDELTGLFNRARLREALEHMLRYFQRYEENGAYLAISIDRLTVITDAFGVESADAVVVAVADRIQQCLRASDILAATAPGTFGAVLARCPEQDLEKAATRIRKAVRSAPVPTPAGPVHVTVSVGAIAVPRFAQGPCDAMGKAELALEQARRIGPDQFCVYAQSPTDRRHYQESVRIAEMVQSAIRDQRLLFAFQPVVEARTGDPAFYECLMRIRTRDGELVPAAKFMPVVERLGMARLVDRHVLSMAFRELEAVPDITLAVNISSITATDRSWLRRLTTLLKRRPDLAPRLIVEITETFAMHDVEEMSTFVAAVRDLGCRVALDDFGAGYTSFRHLKALTIDIVKIDGSFVRDAADNIDDLMFIRTLVSLADGFGLATVAECVEDARTAEVLIAEGVSYLQGYHFGYPSVERPWSATDGLRPVAPGRRAAGDGLVAAVS